MKLTATASANQHLNISPIDNRYKNTCNTLREITSDYGLNKIRCEVEIEYLIMLLKTIERKPITEETLKQLRDIYNNFSKDDYDTIQELEKTTNHDIKALEYFIRNTIEKIISLSSSELQQQSLIPLIHFALTSQDINSISNTLTIKRSIEKIIIPQLDIIQAKLHFLSQEWMTNYMISKTHGQSAVTTSMGKEVKVFESRLSIQLEKLKSIKYTTKFGGAVGNLNAHYLCYPDMSWDKILDNFINSTFNIERNRWTTQIDHYDNICEIFDILKRINIILLDLSQDIWLYISNNYFALKINNQETGSSTMPHKVNPINFENAEGNIYMANSILNMFSSKLPVSRLQRDLTDSTITRNIGSAFSYCLISYTSLMRGLEKLEINNKKLNKDLNENWSILTEGVQCVMKTENIPNAYEVIKKHTRGKQLSKSDYINLINKLELTQDNKIKLLELTPATYSGNINLLPP